MNSRFVLEGVLRTLSPLHIGDARAAFIDPKDGSIKTRNPAGASLVPLKRTVHAPIYAGDNNTRIEVPYIPSEGLKGDLRRQSADAVEEALIARGEKLPMSAYQVLRCGAPHGHPDKRLPTLDEYLLGLNHIYVGLHGGGPRMIESQLNVESCYPILEETVSLGIIPDAYRSYIVPKASFTEEGVQYFRIPTLTHVRFRNRFDDVLRFNDVENASALIENWQEEVAIWQATVGRKDPTLNEDGDGDGNEGEAEAPADQKPTAGKKKSGAAEEKKGARGVRSFTATQFVVPGVPFYFRIECAGSDAQVGMLLESVRRLATSRVGGMGTLGYGRVGFQELTLRHEGMVAPPFEAMDGQLAFNESSPLVQRVVRAFEAEMDALDRDVIVRLSECENEKFDAARKAAIASFGKNRASETSSRAKRKGDAPAPEENGQDA